MTEPMLIWGLSLLAVAALLLVVEVFLPSGGLIAVTSAIVAIAGIVCLFRYDTTWGLLGTLGALIGGPAVLLWGLKIWPDTPVGRAMMYGSGSPEADEKRRVDEADDKAQRRALIGERGEALGPLRPTGTVVIDGQRYDAITDTGFIDGGDPIKVVDVSLRELKVRPA